MLIGRGHSAQPVPPTVHWTFRSARFSSGLATCRPFSIPPGRRPGSRVQSANACTSPSLESQSRGSWWDDENYWLPAQSRGSRRSRLFLAPMEGLGDKNFRRALSIAFPDSFDEASTEFLRLTLPADVCPYSPKAARCYRGMLESFGYDPLELRTRDQDSAAAGKCPNCADCGPPIALQLMIAADQSEVGKGFVQWLFSQAPASCRPHRIDINMGCPSKRTTSRGQQLAGGRTSRGGAGSSLLIDPSLVSNVTAAVRAGLPSTACCLSVKMRVGYDDEALFTENMLAAAEHADYLQIHARTKVDGYHAPARWDRLALAKQVLRPLGCRVVGNGDVDSAQRYETLVKETGVDGVMIGRAAVSNPFIFYEIRSGTGDPSTAAGVGRSATMRRFFEAYYSFLTESQKSQAGTRRYERTVSSKLKQMIAMGFLSNDHVCAPQLVSAMGRVLRTDSVTSETLIKDILDGIDAHM